LFNPALDLLVGCGAWSLPLIALTSLVTQWNAGAMAAAFYFLTVFCNNPHYMATVYRAYHTGADFNQYRFFTIYVTVLLILTVTLVHLVPALFPWVVTAYLIWSPWHYSGQNFGIAMLLARRAGAQPGRLERNLLFASYLVAYAVWLIALQSLEAPDPGLILVRLPRAVTDPLLPLLSLGFVALAGAALVRLARSGGVRVILAPALLSLAQGLWFIGPPWLQHFRGFQLPAAFYTAGILAFMHCAQYLWITTYYARREAEHSGVAPLRPFHFLRYYAILIVGGLALFVPGPWIASRLLGHEFVESFLIFAALVNLHHFILDGAIWKLRDHRVARLLVGFNAPAAREAGTGEGLPELLGWLGGKHPAARSIRYSFVVGVVAAGLLDQTQFNLAGRDAGFPQLARAQTLNPHDARIYFNRARLLMREGNLEAAERELRRALDINPRSVAAQQLMGEVLVKRGATAAAFEHYNRMMELFRPDLASLMNSGVLARQLGSNSLAIQRFDEALSLAPEQARLHYLKADALLAVGDTNAAATEFTRYVRGHEGGAGSPGELPLYLSAGLRLGELQSAGGQWSEAARTWQRAADVATAFRRFSEAAGLLEKVAEAQDRLGQPAAAASSRRAAARAAELAGHPSTP